jgi:rod shape-determining protein MreD
MLLEIIKIIFRFILLVAVQVIVLNNIRLGGYVNPYIYVLFIMMLPVRIPKTLLLVIAFATGLCIDVFSNTQGLHAAASVFLGFIRPTVLRIIAPRDGYEADASPSIKLMGVSWFILYSVIAVFLHHMVLFYVEVFRFSEFFSTLLRVALSSVVTIIFILISQLLFGKTIDNR